MRLTYLDARCNVYTYTYSYAYAYTNFSVSAELEIYYFIYVISPLIYMYNMVPIYSIVS